MSLRNILGFTLCSIIAIAALSGKYLSADYSKRGDEEPKRVLSSPTAAGILIEPLGWRNLQGGGSSSAVAGYEGALSTLTLPSGSNVNLSVTGEAGYKVTWTSTESPPSSLDLNILHSVTFEGPKGEVAVEAETQTAALGQSYDLEADELDGLTTVVYDETAQVSLQINSNNKYTGEIWLPTNVILNRGSSQDPITATLTFFVTPPESEPTSSVDKSVSTANSKF